MKKKAAITSTLDANDLHCEHCKRTFVRESTMLKHMCEQKRRWLDKDRPSNRIGFNAYAQFYKKNYSSKAKTYDDFMRSNYFTAFVKFGGYCINVNVVNPSRYVDYLLDNKIGIDSWDSDKSYTAYLLQYLKHEAVTDAITRSAENLDKLAVEFNILTRDVLRYGNPSTICNHIVSGRISPWVLWQSDAGREFLESKLTSEQTQWIFEYINPEQWQLKFTRNPDEVTQAKEQLKQMGI